MGKDKFNNITSGLPLEWPVDLRADIKSCLAEFNNKLVVIDDDPTGSQIVKDIPILTEWSVEILADELKNQLSAFYITTNTRGMSVDRAIEINAEIGRNLRIVSQSCQKRISLISRGDSTLRGHYPEELDALAEGFGLSFDASFLMPALFGGGRFTINDVHYVAAGDYLVPVGETDYAKDATFGFKASNLKEWVEEKTHGRIKAQEVQSISLDEIRLGGPDAVYAHLIQLPKGSICIINAISRRDIEVFTLAMIRAEMSGKHYLGRTGPSFIPVRIALDDYPLLTREDIPFNETNNGGLIIVGSYVPNTTRQVEEVLKRNLVKSVVVDVERLIDDQLREKAVRDYAETICQEICLGHNVMLYTSRNLITGDDPEASLAIGQRVSASIIDILRHITVQPKYILAKGGITSSDIAILGLGVKRAMVIGQIKEGVSVWALGPETKFKGSIYIVFPGNVGKPDTLAEVISAL